MGLSFIFSFCLVLRFKIPIKPVTKTHQANKMQLADKIPYTIMNIKGVLILAERLRRHLETPVPKREAINFGHALDNSREFFPSFAAAVGSQPQLYNLSPEERRDLKLKLLDDVKLHVAKSSDEVTGSKVLEEAELPSDPEECTRRLNEMMEEGFEKIKAIQRTMTLIGPARNVLCRIKENKQVIEDFNGDVYTSMPVEVAKKPSAKKAKTRG